MNLGEKKCRPCEGGVAPLDAKEIKELKRQIRNDWEIPGNKKLTREYLFVNYRHTMDFVNKVSELAEEEGHHPVMHVYYGRVVIEIWTHAIDGLSENDFILAYKIDKINL
jgi:4a-hydroxytetrahydrobiopterin dehydratase